MSVERVLDHETCELFTVDEDNAHRERVDIIASLLSETGSRAHYRLSDVVPIERSDKLLDLGPSDTSFPTLRLHRDPT